MTAGPFTAKSVKSVQRQLEGAVCTGIVAQGSQSEADVGSSVEYVLLEIGLGAVQQDLTGLADPAAQNHSFRVHNAAQVCQEFAQQSVILVQNGQSHFVTGFTGIENVLTGDSFQNS